jgi:predicted dehydrogenase
MTKIKIGVIGYGYWGPNMVRNFFEAPGAQVTVVSDLRSERLSMVQGRYPTVRVTQKASELIEDPDVDAVIVSTPVSSHYELALHALQAGKHVLVEKPLTTTTDQAQALIEEAERKKRILMVDHTFVYTGAVRKIHDLIASGELGDVYYYDSVRVNLGLFQHDVSVLWDLAVHDLSIMDYILPVKPIAVSATGSAHVKGAPEDVAYLSLHFDNNIIAHVHANWLAPVKIRRTLIGGSRKMIVYDDLEPSEKIKIYDKGITLKDNTEDMYKLLVGYRTGDMLAPQIDGAEALRTEAIHFLKCIEEGKHPLTDGQAGLQVVRILEAATLSIQEKGKPVELKNP